MSIISKPATDEYRKNFNKVFGKITKVNGDEDTNKNAEDINICSFARGIANTAERNKKAKN